MFKLGLQVCKWSHYYNHPPPPPPTHTHAHTLKCTSSDSQTLIIKNVHFMSHGTSYSMQLTKWYMLKLRKIISGLTRHLPTMCSSWPVHSIQVIMMSPPHADLYPSVGGILIGVVIFALKPLHCHIFLCE